LIHNQEIEVKWRKRITFATMMQLEKNNEWFATWFDSPYYHLLYDNRDEQEAADFLQRLRDFLPLQKGAQVLDLACGAGRHSRVLQQLGYSVSGCDLSPNSIHEALAYPSNTIPFFVHDMRQALPENYDGIFNLFTSFGYFEEKNENIRVLNSIHRALNSNGVLIIDFMNATKVIQHLQTRQEIQKGDITFFIQRAVVNGRIVKTIAFEAEGQSFCYQEKVQALCLSDFESLLAETGFTIEQKFGDYALAPYDVDQSDRLILICKKR
jgi:SAM-dependent methyltransferase